MKDYSKQGRITLRGKKSDTYIVTISENIRLLKKTKRNL